MAKEATKRQRRELSDNPAERFKQVATYRVNNVLSVIEGMDVFVGKTYEYTDDQVDRLCDAIDDKVTDLRTKLKSRTRVSSGGITL